MPSSDQQIVTQLLEKTQLAYILLPQIKQRSPPSLGRKRVNIRNNFLQCLAIISSNDRKAPVAISLELPVNEKPRILVAISSSSEIQRRDLVLFLENLHSRLMEDHINRRRILRLVFEHIYVKVKQDCAKFLEFTEEKSLCELVLERAKDQELSAIYKGLIQRFEDANKTSSSSLETARASLAARFLTEHEKFDQYFPWQSKFRRQLLRITSYALAADTIIRYADSACYKLAFQNVDIYLLPLADPKPEILVRDPQTVWKQFGRNATLEDFDTKHRIHKHQKDPDLVPHPELMIAEYLKNNGKCHLSVGVSKPCCYLCFRSLQDWAPELSFTNRMITTGRIPAIWIPPASAPVEILARLESFLETELYCMD